MDKTSGATSSIWLESIEIPDQRGLQADAGADVCIVGAGIAGLTTAYLLSVAGQSVIVLGSQSSGRPGQIVSK